MLYDDKIIDLLDRKYNFVANSADDIYLLELQKFVYYIGNEEPYKQYVAHLLDEWTDKIKEHENYMNEILPTIIELKDKLISKYPELDDSTMQRPATHHVPPNYRCSFAYFNDILHGKREKSYPMTPEPYHDRTDIRALLNIINSKITDYEKSNTVNDTTKHIDDAIMTEYVNLNNTQEFKHNDFVNYQRVSPGASLEVLIDIANIINAPPQKIASMKESILNSREFQIALYCSDIYKAAYEYRRNKSGFASDPQMQEFKQRRTWCMAHLKRIYEALREQIGTYFSHLRVINRYKTRCMWYDRGRLRSLVIDNKGKYIQTRENTLTVDLARYLFDNGITVLYRARFGIHEVDLVDPAARSPIFVEAKAYIGARNTKKRLIDGVSQIHSYLNNLESKYAIREAYYVIFRLGGPIYDLPEKIVFQRFAVIPIVIDMAESTMSGSRQPKPVIIKRSEIAEAVEDYKIGQGNR
ncbi:hypothetical protein IBX73_10215 [candidate division WOR-3 bacterium]|nr:hypothetical protein [candidate division WOR-3 bacterium]